MVEFDRRGLLLGLGAALAAPAIVKVDAIMPVRSLRYERFVLRYLIGTDTECLRMDCAQFSLSDFRNRAVISADEARRLVPPDVWRKFKSLRPESGQQLTMDMMLGGSRDYR